MTAPSRASRHSRARPPSTGHRCGWALLVSAIRFLGRVVRGLIAATVLGALVAGLPWALWHYIGWPLPHHIPAMAEIQAVLLNPMSTTFLLDFLACAIWIVWAFFVMDVLRCTVDLVRGGLDTARLPDFSTTGPMHALAGVLIGAILLSLLGNRHAPTLAATAIGPGERLVATAPDWRHSASGNDIVVRSAVLTTQTSVDTATATPGHPVSVVVLAPHNGVYDSLSRIAQRTLGDAGRWPEIFALNKNKPQPYGHTFTNPNLIFPGEELVLPADASAPATSVQPSQTASVPAPPPEVRPSRPATTPGTPAPATPQPAAATGTQARPTMTRQPGFGWGPELFVGLGLAAAVSAALLVARRRYRARYRPGSGDRGDLPVAPVVYRLRLAHLRADGDDQSDLDNDDSADVEGQDLEGPQHVPPPSALVIGASTAGQPGLAPELGVREGREIALDLASSRGLGVVGEGSAAAVRALLVAALTTGANHSGPGVSVLVPAADLAAVLGRRTAQPPLPRGLRVVADLAEALDMLEAETLVRAAEPGRESWPPLVLVTRPPRQHQRLQAVLDNGAPFGITGFVLGQWKSGVTCYVRQDGTISATGPGLGEALRGTRMFRLGGGDTAELLTLLHQAEPDAHSDNGDGDRPDPVSDAELEVIAAAPAPASVEGELEILTPLRPAEAGVPGGAGDLPAAFHERDSTATPPASPADSAGHRADTPRALITIAVLGALRVHWHPETGPEREITGALQPRTRELLVLLALHPGGTTRDALVSALWGEDPPARPTNALHTALSRLRRDLAEATGGAVADIAPADNGHYRLDPATVRVDYWRFANAVAARRAAATDAERIAAYREVVDSYGGPLAEGMAKLEWIEPVREAIRRDALDAVSGLARALVETDPQQTLDLLEIARAFDPHNELLYRDIMRLQERLGQLDAIPRTLTLLSTRLAELNEQPTPQARGLAARLGQRRDHDPANHAAVAMQRAAGGEREPRRPWTAHPHAPARGTSPGQ